MAGEVLVEPARLPDQPWRVARRPRRADQDIRILGQARPAHEAGPGEVRAGIVDIRSPDDFERIEPPPLGHEGNLVAVGVDQVRVAIVRELDQLRRLERGDGDHAASHPLEEVGGRATALEIEAAHHLRQLLELAQRLPLDGPLRREGQARASPGREQLGQDHGAASPHGHRASHDHERVAGAALRHVARGRPQIAELGPARLRTDRRGDADDGGLDAAGQGRGNVETIAQKCPERLVEAGLVEVRPAAGERVEHGGRGVHAVHGEALAGERHRHREPHVAQPHHPDRVHGHINTRLATLLACGSSAVSQLESQSNNPSATSRLAFSRSARRPMSSQYSRIRYAATTRSRSRSVRIRSVASKYSPAGISSTADGSRR